MRCSGPRLAIAECFEPFERQRQVRASLAGNERVDLIDDDRVERGEPLSRVRREEQEERLRCCDEDVGGIASEARAVGAGVSPVRIAISGTVIVSLCARATVAMPASGARRLRSTSTASALSGEMYRTRQRDGKSAAPARTSDG